MLKSDLLGAILSTSGAKGRKAINRISWDPFLSTSGSTQPASQPRSQEASQTGRQETWLTGCLAGKPTETIEQRIAQTSNCIIVTHTKNKSKEVELPTLDTTPHYPNRVYLRIAARVLRIILGGPALSRATGRAGKICLGARKRPLRPIFSIFELQRKFDCCD